ncbi:HYR domain-containing protein [Myxococcaceae bacterium GXIMD 01537]
MDSRRMLRACGAMLLAGVMSCVDPVELEDSSSPARGASVQRLGAATAPVLKLFDLNGGGDVGSEPTAFTAINGTVYFAATDTPTGEELWRTDGTEAGTVQVKDIEAGPYGSDPHGFTPMGDSVFFSSLGLWKTDGTQAGTVQVHASYPRIEPPENTMVVLNGALFYSAVDFATRREELWRSDGTAAGTAVLKKLAGNTATRPRWLTVVNQTLFFTIADSTAGEELWMSDGTAVGTVRVRDIRPGTASSNPRNLVNVNGTLFFTANDGTTGEELWRSNGTAAGTVRVRDILAGSTGSAPELLTAMNGTLFFVLDANVNPAELWQSDGTSAGTVRVASLPASLVASSSRVIGPTLYLALTSTNGSELWRTDGTPQGTMRVERFPVFNPDFPSLRNLTDVGGSLAFSVEGFEGSQLWRSNGWPFGSEIVKRFQFGWTGSAFSSMALVDGALYFAASDGVHGSELWKSDGTEAGTVLVRNIETNAFGSNPSSMMDVDGKLFFEADTPSSGLWKVSQGLTASRLPPGSIWNPTRAGGLLYFGAIDGAGHELWKSDGTAAGTVRVKDIWPGSASSSPHSGVDVNGELFFFAYGETTGGELWKSDGTEEGTVLVKDIRPGSAHSYATPLANVGGTLFLSANDGVNGTELWKSDGTEAGTVLVKDLNPGGDGTPQQAIAVGGTLFFTAYDGVSGLELWKSDGTAAGTQRVKDIFPGSQDPYIWHLTASGGKAFFDAFDGVNGDELWVSDGTEAGTRIVDLGLHGSNPLSLIDLNGTLLFWGWTEATGTELWRTDGTALGTKLVKDICAGASSSVTTWTPLKEPVVLDGEVYFTADDCAHGEELWKSDGTAAGTVRVTDLVPGPGSAYPEGLTVSGKRIFFHADDGVHGRELWVLSYEPPDTTPPQVTCPAPVVVEALGAFGAKASFPAAQVSDDSNEPPSLSSTHASGSDFPLGVTTVTVTATDDAGNVASCQFTVTVKDSTAPAVTCPEPVVAEATSASGATVDYPVAGASDAVSSVTLAYSHASGMTFAVGDTPVTVTAMDAAGNEATCHFTVTVRDTVAPVVTCPAEVVTEATGPSGAAVGFVLPSASDAVTTSPPVTASHAPGSTFGLGSTEVTLTAKDDAGNASSCQFTVTVRDTTAPQVTCPADLVAEAQDVSGASVSFTVAEPKDAVTLSPSVVVSHASGSRFSLGNTEVSVTAKDAAGNQASCSFTVTVRDTTAPSFTCPENLIVEATGASGATASYVLPTAVDAVTASPGVTTSHASGSTFALGETLVTLTAKDEAGNEASCRFTVTVKDTTAPRVSCPADVTVEAMGASGATVTYPAASASDAVSSVTPAYSQASGTEFPLGETTVTATATDAAGNTASCQLKVTVRDTTPPNVGCAPDLVVEAEDASGADVAYLLARPRDTVTREPLVNVSHGPGSRFPLGATEVSVTATDEAGNAASCRFTVTVRDTTAPQVTCPADVVAEAQDASGALVPFTLTSALDTVTAEPTVELSHASGSRFSFGATEVFLTAADAAGNAASCRFTVTVRDTTAPQVTCPADVSVETLDPEGTVVTYASASASDGGSAVTLDYSQPSGGLFAPGATRVSVTATDVSGNVGRCDFQVSVSVRKPVSVPVFPGGCSSASGPLSLAWSTLVLLGWHVARRRSRVTR